MNHQKEQRVEGAQGKLNGMEKKGHPFKQLEGQARRKKSLMERRRRKEEGRNQVRRARKEDKRKKAGRQEISFTSDECLVLLYRTRQ